MKRYIDVDAFIKRLKEHIYINARIDGDRSIGKTLATVIDEMNAFPSADVEEVKHGKWVHDAGCLFCEHRCSRCGYKWDYNSIDVQQYCSNCGAKMDGKDE